MIVQEITCKSALTPSGISSIDYALNLYVGCQHKCAYCYAVFMKRFTGHREEWGEFVDVRVNAPEVLARQLKRIKAGSVNLGTVTDCYQPLEREYRLAQRSLEALAPYDSFPTTVLTKSALVLRDLDVLRQMKDVQVAFTMTSLDDAVRQVFEPFASPVSQRLEALTRLHEAGIRTWAFFGPVLPALSDSEEAVDAMFSALGQAGVAHVLVDSLNLRGAQAGPVQQVLRTHYPHLIAQYLLLQQDRSGYNAALAKRVALAAERHHVPYELAF